jgi:hypothetical protein
LKKIFKHRILKKALPIFVILFFVLIGVIKIDMINTKALSPIGNTTENYKLVSAEFGSDFANFIKDNSFLKIYKDSDKYILIRLGNSDFKIQSESTFMKNIKAIFEKIKL